MKTYLAFFRIRFTNSLQYRSAALAGVATQFAWGLMELLAFSAFYRSNPLAFPMSFAQTASYIWLQQAFLALFMTWFFENDIFEAITSGNLAYDLARPVDLYNKWLCQTSANRLAKAVLRCMPVLIVAFLVPAPYRLLLPPSPKAFFLFLLSMVLTLGVVTAFSMLVYISAFYTLSATGIRVVFAALADFLAGAVIPLPFFPEDWQKVLNFLPFAAMQNTPLRIYSGHLQGVQAFTAVGLQLFWLIVLVGAGRVWMSRGLKKVIIQGG